MKILFVADSRSPIALSWMKYWTKREHEVTLVSTFSAEIDLPISRVEIVPAAFSRAKSPASTSSRQTRSPIWGAATLPVRLAIRHWLGPLTLPKAAARLNEIIADVQPEIIHAMRIPYEGMLAATAKKHSKGNFPPLLISVWGNDFTLHAPSSPLMRSYTRLALRAADALHADCERDIRLAQEWGFDTSRPTIVLPGGGGINMSVFHPSSPIPAFPRKGKESILPPTGGDAQRTEGGTIINPRGIRSYVRNDTFFKAIPLVLKERPEAKFICPTMQGDAQAETRVRELGIESSVQLTPSLTRKQLAKGWHVAAFPLPEIWNPSASGSSLKKTGC